MVIFIQNFGILELNAVKPVFSNVFFSRIYKGPKNTKMDIYKCPNPEKNLKILFYKKSDNNSFILVVTINGNKPFYRAFGGLFPLFAYPALSLSRFSLKTSLFNNKYLLLNNKYLLILVLL